MTVDAKLADVSLADKYRLERGRVFLTAMQALVRLPMLQRERDRAAGLNTAGYVSGYRGSPVGGLDTALHEAQPFLAAHDIRFHPGGQRGPRGHRDLGHAAAAPAARRPARRHLRHVVRQGPRRRPLRRRLQARQLRRHLPARRRAGGGRRRPQRPLVGRRAPERAHLLGLRDSRCWRRPACRTSSTSGCTAGPCRATRAAGWR